MCQDNKLFINFELSLTDLYVVDLEIIKKIDDGLCDCSIGQKRKNNDCGLYEIKITDLKYQADSAVFLAYEILNHTRLLVSQELMNKIKAGDNLNVILTNTSSREYLRLKSILKPVLGKEFRFSSEMRLTSLLECEDEQLTFKSK